MSMPFASHNIRKKDLWIYFIFPLSQGLIVAYLFYLMLVWKLGISFFMLVSCLGVACVPVDLLLLRMLRQFSHSRVSEERGKMLSKQLIQQKLHKESLLQDIEAARKIRNELASELKNAYILFEQQKDIEAIKHLNDALESVTISKKQFCCHPVVDALLEDKSRICEKYGIQLTCEVDVPENLLISNVELCSVFANILDNAINACRDCVAGMRFINLKAHTTGGFFIIKTLNSNSQLRHSPRRGSRLSKHGWGIFIMSEIASRYAGEFKIEPLEDGFQSVIWLKV